MLPLPDRSVDAVVTDPPYFDFIHYSELSDFFFSWLSPILKDRYSWFDRPSSFALGEVQNKNPRVFARELAAVFADCCRVLKDDGVLAFSFHHSRPEGWAAIHEAISTAGLAVVAAHPVHAELRAATPKSAAKEPISIDAILVCRKRSSPSPALDEKAAVANAKQLAERLEAGGMSLSSADRFVILCSQMLIVLADERKGFGHVVRRLQQAAQQMNMMDA
jgi:putative DNA methylase